MSYQFPTSYFAPAGDRYYLTGRLISSGQSAAGIIQVTKTDGGGLWVFEFTGIDLRVREKLLGYRAFEGLIDGGSAAIIVPICDIRQAPVRLVDGRPYYGTDIPHSDNTLFADDGTGYGDPIITAETVGDAALRATTLTIKITDGGVLLSGMHFSFLHSVMNLRLYRVITITAADEETGTYTVKIRPPLRQAVVDGTDVEFQHPGCLMRCTNPDAMAPRVDMHRFATADVSFIEAFE